MEEFFLRKRNFSKVFEINNYFEDFNIIIKTKNKIQKYKEIFSNLARNYPAYNMYFYDSAPINNNMIQKFKLDDIKKSLNDYIDDINNEKFDKFKGDINFKCQIGLLEKNLQFISFNNFKFNYIFNRERCHQFFRNNINTIINNTDRNNFFISIERIP